MFRRNKLFFWTTEILLITLIFYLWREMGAIITPFVSVVNTIMIPFLLGGFLYYLTNPIVIFLEKECRINRIIWDFVNPLCPHWFSGDRCSISFTDFNQSVE